MQFHSFKVTLFGFYSVLHCRSCSLIALVVFVVFTSLAFDLGALVPADGTISYLFCSLFILCFYVSFENTVSPFLSSIAYFEVKNWAMHYSANYNMVLDALPKNKAVWC